MISSRRMVAIQCGITLSTMLLATVHGAQDPARARGHAAIQITGLQENQYANPNGIYIRASLRAYEQHMDNKGQKNVCSNTRQVDVCYIQLAVFDDQPAYVILPSRTCYREPRATPNYYWEMYTTGEWQYAGSVEQVQRVPGHAGFWRPGLGGNAHNLSHLARGKKGLIRVAHLKNSRNLCGPDQLPHVLPDITAEGGNASWINIEQHGEGLQQLHHELLAQFTRSPLSDAAEDLYREANVLLGQITRALARLRAAPRAPRAAAPRAQPQIQLQVQQPGAQGPAEEEAALLRQMAALNARLAEVRLRANKQK